MKKNKEFLKFGKFCKLARKNRGLTQADLAKKLGYETPQFVSNVERGFCAYPLPKFRQLAKLLKVDLISGLAEHYMADEVKRIGKGIGI